MDAVTFTTANGVNLFALFSTVMWYSIRVGAAMQVMPAIGGRTMPARVRLLFTLVLGAVLSTLLPSPPPAAVDAATALNVLREFLVGVSIGLIIKLAFEAGILAGQFASQGMALSFATMTDPNNQSVPIVSSWYFIAFGLLFITLDGHLVIVQILLESYQTQPIGSPIHDWQTLIAGVPAFFSVALRFAVLLSLPIIVTMLAVNTIAGVLARAAPQFNPIQIGMPAALVMGLALLTVLARDLLDPVRALFEQAFEAARALTG